MTLDDLDALIDACPGAAMILLEERDWRATMRDRPLVRRGAGGLEHVVYRELPVLVVSPGPSRVLSGDQVRAEGLDQLGREPG